MTREHFFRELAKRLRHGRAVLATVQSATGSTPRYAGAQMCCGEEWSLGTIGGGVAESRVINSAREVIDKEEPIELMVDLRGTSEQPRDGICGGVMHVRLDPLPSSMCTSLDVALNALADGLTVRQLFPQDGKWSLEVTSQEVPTSTNPGDGTGWIVPDPLLLVVGGGHCGQALARVASTLGFRVLIQDDRPEVANEEMLPKGCMRSSESVSETLNRVHWYGALYAAIVSRSYRHDIEALQSLASVDCAYVGLMGSKRRVSHVCNMLRSEGLDEDFIRSLDTPIGIAIGAESPEEIAVSICAKLVEVKRSHLSSLQGATSDAT